MTAGCQGLSVTSPTLQVRPDAAVVFFPKALNPGLTSADSKRIEDDIKGVNEQTCQRKIDEQNKLGWVMLKACELALNVGVRRDDVHTPRTTTTRDVQPVFTGQLGY